MREREHPWSAAWQSCTKKKEAAELRQWKNKRRRKDIET